MMQTKKNAVFWSKPGLKSTICL